MRPKSLALLLLALGCGLVASIGITRVMTTWTEKPDATMAGTDPVVVATADVGMGEMLSAEQIKLESWPKGKIPSGAVCNLKDAEGRRTRTRLYAGEPILENKLFAKGSSQQGAAAMIPEGYRLVTVKVDLVSGGGSLILPGDRVDVMVYMVRDLNRGIHDTVTRTILQNIKVFAVNDVLDVEKDGSRSIAAKTISLLVTPEQAAKVMLASEMGTVNLVMRSPEDERQVADAQAKPSELLGAPAVAEHAPPPSPPEPLVSVKTLPAPEEMQTTDSAKPRQVWAMRVIKANEVGEVRFEQDEPAADGSAGLELWKTTTSAEVPGKSKTDSHPATENAVIDLPKNQDSNRSKTEGDRAI